MGIKDKIVSAYHKVVGNGEKDEYDFGMLTDIDNFNADLEEPNEAILREMDDETRKFLAENKEKLGNIATPPKYIPVHFLTDVSTATDVLALFGMIRWAMERSATNDKEYEFNVRIRNRNGSPFLVGMGNVSIPKVAVQNEFSIGN